MNTEEVKSRAAFSKKAMQIYKDIIAKVKKGTDWVDEMNFTYSPDTIFRVWYDHTLDNGKGGYMHRWCSLHTVEVKNNDLKDITKHFDAYLSDNNASYSQIYAALKRGLKKTPNNTVESIVITVKGQKERINLITELEFTPISRFCDMCGIELEEGD